MNYAITERLLIFKQKNRNRFDFMKQQKHLLLFAFLTLFLCILIAAGCTEQAPQEKNGKIIGIEPGAGIMSNTENAITNYDLSFDLVSSSSAGMASELTKAIKNNEWIVVTGWTPHWMFARYDLKYLDDPLGAYGSEEYIATLARKGLKEDNPGVYGIIERFSWTPADMESVMLAVEGGDADEDAAKTFVDANQDRVLEWIGDDTTQDGEKVTIGYVLWDSEIASTNVIKLVLEQAGYSVKLIAVDAGPLYQAVANGDVDFTISAWLPGTQANYWDTYGEELVMVRENLQGARVGLVVPSYVTIDSIDQLNSVKDKF